MYDVLDILDPLYCSPHFGLVYRQPPTSPKCGRHENIASDVTNMCSPVSLPPFAPHRDVKQNRLPLPVKFLVGHESQGRTHL